MQVVPITERIYLEPKHLTSNIRSCLENKIKQRKGTCSKSLGYIIDTEDILSIHDNTILRSSPYVVFTITYQAKIFKPTIGDVYKSKVEEILPSRIRCKYELVNIMVPSIYLKNLTYNSDSKSFIGKDKANSVKLNDTVNIRIERIKYSSGSSESRDPSGAYLCIGKLV